MKLRSPSVAILWELWRVTRAEVAWKLALPTGAAMVILALSSSQPEIIKDSNAALMLVLIVIPHLFGWVSMAKLINGRPGFPLYLHYTRPVRTAVIVGLPMGYLTAMSSAIYLVSALLLRVTSGDAFPLLPVAAWMAALTVIGVAATWSTRNRTIQMYAMGVATLRAWYVSVERLTAVEIEGNYDWPPRLWPTLFDWPLTDYAWIALIGIASFGVTVAMVTRRRRGDELAASTRAAITWTPIGGWWDWLVGLFRVPCPTSSATRAQLWFDLKSNGFPILTIGVALAIAVLMMTAVSGPLDTANLEAMRGSAPCVYGECITLFPVMPVLFAVLSLFIVLVLAGNTFGIRRRQGRTYISAFAATQAYGTAQLAALKLLVMSVCVLAALVAIGISVWISLPLLREAPFIQMWNVRPNSLPSVITDAVAALTGYEQLSLVVVAAAGVVIWVATFAVFGALRTRYSRRTNIAVGLLLLYGVALVWLAVGIQVDPKTASRFHLDVVYGAMRWIAAAAMVFTTVYVFRSGFAERVLTIRYASSAVAMSAAFGAAWLTVLHMAGVQLAGMSAINAVSILSPALLPLMVSALAPWSFSRVRHT